MACSTASRPAMAMSISRAPTRMASRVYIEHVLFGERTPVKSRVIARLSKSLDWFRQSFAHRASPDEATVALAVAFETLLTDFYARGVGERVVRCVALATIGLSEQQTYRDAIGILPGARGEVLHTGETERRIVLAQARETFVHSFMFMAERLDQIAEGQMPICDLLADITNDPDEVPT